VVINLLKGFMKNTRYTGLLLSVLMTLVGVTAFSSAYADDYSDVSQLIRAGKLPEALVKADQFLSGQPKDPQMRFLKGVAQRESGKTSDAIGTFTRLTEDYPELPEPYNNLAVLYAGQGQYDKARTALEMAIHTNPSYSTAHENLGDVYAKLASQAYNKALLLDNTNAAVVPKLALIKELFSPAGTKTLRPAAATPGASPPMVAALSPSKAPPAPPTLPGIKPPPSPSGQAANGNNGAVGNTPVVAPSAQPAPAAVVTAPAPAAAAIAPNSPSASAPKPAPAVTTSVAGTAGANKEVENLVRAWASAWSAKDVKTYLSLYGKEFDPPGNMNRASWEEERRVRISGKASISVKLENLSVSVNGTKATAKFRQDYRANGLAVSSRKVLELTKSGEHWRIVKESIAN
jgi:ketosteroid isomerase-like protein